jgi:4-diphosphocytidyl-2-C-methyl-D-erythritol kinase
VTPTLTAEAPAKVNLDLRVLAREASGFHQIETVLLLVDLCDVVVASRGQPGISVEVLGSDLGALKENLVYRAAEGFFQRCGVEPGVKLRLEKHIPAGAGLGGGSSDGATTLRLLNALFGEPLSRAELVEVAGDLGGDVPFFLTETGFALGWGRGGRLLSASAPEPRHVVLAMPHIHISTADAYAALSEVGLNPAVSRMVTGDALSDWNRLASEAHNDFEVVAFSKHPMLSRIREVLVEGGADVARMSGSGSTVFGVFGAPQKARAAAEEITSGFDCECVVVPSRTRWTDLQVNEG